MIPALDWLEANASKFGAAEPAAFYFGSGFLSSLLDNTPTNLSFMSALFGVLGTRDIHLLFKTRSTFVLAISVGSMFFDAGTYIGNGPNLLVKSIAGQWRIHSELHSSLRDSPSFADAPNCVAHFLPKRARPIP